MKRLFTWIYAKLTSPKINLVKLIYFIICEKKAQALKNDRMSGCRYNKLIEMTKPENRKISSQQLQKLNQDKNLEFLTRELKSR